MSGPRRHAPRSCRSTNFRYHSNSLEDTTLTRHIDDMFRTAAWHLRHVPGAVVILDGRTCSRAYQVTQVRRFATRVRQPLRLIECVCADTIVEQRLTTDIACGTHPASGHHPALSECANRVLAYL